MIPRIVAFGDNVVDCYADHDLMFPGGNALNFSVFVRRFRGASSYIGAVADDAAGRLIRFSLIAEGVDVSGLRVLPGRTAFCLIGHQSGEREFIGANLGVSIIAPVSADLARIAAADAVHTGRSSHIEAHLGDFAALAPLSYDFAEIRDPTRIGRIAPLCRLASFSGSDLADHAVAALRTAALSAGAQHVLITRGAAGAELAGPGYHVCAGAAPGKVLDTLGAGDTVIARVLIGLLRDEEPRAILAAAATAAARTCAQLGAFGHSAPIEADTAAALPLSEIYPGEGSRP